MSESHIIKCKDLQAVISDLLLAALRIAYRPQPLDTIKTLKDQANAIFIETSKQHWKREQVAAAETVRRAERALGLLIRKGQSEGLVVKRGSLGGTNGSNTKRAAEHVQKTTRWLTLDESRAIVPMVDGIGDEDFEAALAQARDEWNLSRANVIRILMLARGSAMPAAVRALTPAGAKQRRWWSSLPGLAADGHTAAQIADILGVSRGQVVVRAARLGVEIQAEKVVGGGRRFDQNRFAQGFCGSLDAMIPSCDMMSPKAVDRAILTDCDTVLREALTAFRKLQRRIRAELALKEEIKSVNKQICR